MSQYTPDAWIEREEENDPTQPWCATCERHGEDCICNPDGDETVAEYEAREGLNFCSHIGCVDTAGTGGYCAFHAGQTGDQHPERGPWRVNPADHLPPFEPTVTTAPATERNYLVQAPFGPPREPGEHLADYIERYTAKPKVGICDVCGGDQDRLLPDGICMPCSISWEFHRTNQP